MNGSNPSIQITMLDELVASGGQSSQKTYLSKSIATYSKIYFK